MSVTAIKPQYVELMPEKLEERVLYISQQYNVAIHLCACGCSQKVVTPINKPGEWQLTDNNGMVSLYPSIGNFKGQKPYHAHYFITNNEIVWS